MNDEELKNVKNASETKAEKKIDIDALKKQHGKIYQITTELVEDDENVTEKRYIFTKPKTASYDRYIKTASKGATKALQAFLLDNIIPDQQNELEKDLEEYPALTLGVGEKLLNLLGLSNNVNLMKL